MSQNNFKIWLKKILGLDYVESNRNYFYREKKCLLILLNALLTLLAQCISESCIKIKINSNFYFHTSLWSIKKFYEGLKSIHKTF